MSFWQQRNVKTTKVEFSTAQNDVKSTLGEKDTEQNLFHNCKHLQCSPIALKKLSRKKNIRHFHENI
jgi:hypothetical protein